MNCIRTPCNFFPCRAKQFEVDNDDDGTTGEGGEDDDGDADSKSRGKAGKKQISAAEERQAKIMALHPLKVR